MNAGEARMGRPRSERSRTAVLHAVDDLLVEVGYRAMTMKTIAERAGVGRQTIYRWWATKADILVEAVADDASEELAVTPTGSVRHDIAAYVERLLHFLSQSETGTAYRALLGEAQHDPAVAALIASHDVVTASARRAIETAVPEADPRLVAQAAVMTVGPIVFLVLSGGHAGGDTQSIATAVVDGVVGLLTDRRKAASEPRR